jgi:hypothetical protein
MKKFLLSCLLILSFFSICFCEEAPLTYYTFENTSKVLEYELFIEVNKFIEESIFFENMSKELGDEICISITTIIKKYNEQSKVIMYRDPKVILFGVTNGVKKIPTFIILNMGLVLYDPINKESYSLDIIRLFKIKLRQVNET